MNLGRGQLMALAAVRYCLGRSSYIVGDCADWLITIWPELSSDTRALIRRDIEDAFDQDDRARSAALHYKPLGDDCDRRQWERVRALWASDAADGRGG